MKRPRLGRRKAGVVPAGRPFKTEVELCAAFIKALPPEWTAYNECCGWDILLVRNADGFQIGVQAKLRLNTDVIDQALEEGSFCRVAEGNPDCRAVLVPPDGGGHFGKICAYAGLTVIRMRSPIGTLARYNRAFDPDLPERDQSWSTDVWYEMAPARRHVLPEYVPDVKAGASAPLQLTQWKIKAIKIAVTLELRGFVTRHDFAHLQIDHRRWRENGWLKIEDGRYVAAAPPDFKRQHPRVYEQVKADAPKWMQPAPTLDLIPPPRLPL